MVKTLQVLMATLVLAGLALANPLLEEKFWKTATPADVEQAVQQGAKLDARDKDGLTPLHWAASGNSNPKVILTLLELGADPRARTSSNATLWNLMEMNDKLKNTPVYWQLNKLHF
ncbi:MAG: hypothetical protein C4298_07625 [Thermus sp.]